MRARLLLSATDLWCRAWPTFVLGDGDIHKKYTYCETTKLLKKYILLCLRNWANDIKIEHYSEDINYLMYLY